jgi:hypothetical protein
MGTLTLADPGVRPTDSGHEYVLSRRPDDLERTALVERLHSIDLAEPPSVRYRGADVIQVTGLTTRTRPVLEAVLSECLIATNRASATAETVGRGGRQFGEQAAEDDARMVAAVRESFAQLPAELP